MNLYLSKITHIVVNYITNYPPNEKAHRQEADCLCDIRFLPRLQLDLYNTPQ